MEPSLLNRDVNAQFQEFLETVLFNYKTSTVVDPYTQAPLAETTSKIALNVSWHDVMTQGMQIDSSGGAVLGELSPGDAFCIYQGSLNLFTYQLPKNFITRHGISYVVNEVVNHSENRWVLTLKRVK